MESNPKSNIPRKPIKYDGENNLMEPAKFLIFFKRRYIAYYLNVEMLANYGLKLEMKCCINVITSTVYDNKFTLVVRGTSEFIFTCPI